VELDDRDAPQAKIEVAVSELASAARLCYLSVQEKFKENSL